MTRQTVEGWIATHWWQVVVTAFSVGVGYTVITASVSGKVDRPEYQAHVQGEAIKDSLIFRELRTIRALECRDKPQDSYCLP